jgi:transcription elongation GreA/GreB family factor
MATAPKMATISTAVRNCARSTANWAISPSRVFFGATVTLVDEDDAERTVTLVGEDEADASAGRISWRSPLAFALKGAAVGDVRRVTLPGGAKEWEVAAIEYPPSTSSC